MRKEIFNEENKKARRKFQRISVRVFYGMILGIGFIGLLIPLRPKTSESEKRDLTKFPTPTVETVMSGEFFSDISTWYADTFPFREALSTANSKFRQLYGRTTEELHGGPVEADAIPDADAEITATPTPEPEAEPTATPAAEVTVRFTRNLKRQVPSILLTTGALSSMVSALTVPTIISI